MRIAIVTTSWPASPGDASGHFVATEAAELERAGHEIVVVTPVTGGPDCAFGWPGAGARIRQRPSRALDAVRWVLEGRARVATLAVDRIVAHWALPCAWPIASASLHTQIDVVSHGGDVRLLVGAPRGVRDRLARAIAERASSWRFVSHALREELLSRLGPRSRACVERIAKVRAASFEMPNVREAAARLREELGEQRCAVIVGRLVQSKRVDRAIDYVARAPIAYSLIVVGDGPERGRLERHARSRGIDARFVGVLPRERALTWMAAADVVLHASETEGLSTVLREAEALGKQVVRVPG